MKALIATVRALKRRKDTITTRLQPLKTKLAAYDAELEQIDQALEVVEPMSKKTPAAAAEPAVDRDSLQAMAEARWRAGDPPTQISRELGVHVTTLYSWKSRLNWPKQPKKGAR